MDQEKYEQLVSLLSEKEKVDTRKIKKEELVECIKRLILKKDELGKKLSESDVAITRLEEKVSDLLDREKTFMKFTESTKESVASMQKDQKEMSDNYKSLISDLEEVVENSRGAVVLSRSQSRIIRILSWTGIIELVIIILLVIL